MSIPSFGGERRGAPLIAITRVSETQIRKRNLTADPDYVIILDDSLISTALSERTHDKPRHIIINSTKTVADLNLTEWQPITIVDAGVIALEVLGKPIVNTVMLGVLGAVADLASIESIKKAIAEVTDPEIVKKNVLAAEAGFRATKR